MPVAEHDPARWDELVRVNLSCAFDIAGGQSDVGNVATPMTEGMATGVLQPDGATRAAPSMDRAHAGAAVARTASFPLAANVLFTTAMAMKMPDVGRGRAAQATPATRVGVGVGSGRCSRTEALNQPSSPAAKSTTM
ncbi:MAG: hypothetical protein ACLFTG_09185 [Alphaproteobacteria bacterium]